MNMAHFRLASVFVVLCAAYYGEAQRCSTALTEQQFNTLLKSTSGCYEGEVSVLHKTSDILLSLYDDDDQLTGQLSQTQLDSFCRSLTACTTAFTAANPNCGIEINTLFENMGDSLCFRNGSSKLSELSAAVESLKASTFCDVNDVGSAPLPNGCHLQEKDVNYPSYYSKVIRERSKAATTQRCLLRYLDAYAVDCNKADITEYSKLVAAGEEAQYLTQDFSSYTDFNMQFNEDSGQTVLSYYGVGQIANGDDVTTCGLTSAETAIWTSYYRVITDYYTLEPTQMSSVIKSVDLMFSNLDGTALGAYSAYSDFAKKDGLPSILSSNTNPSLLSIRSTRDLVKISHEPAATDFYVYLAGSTLGITIVTPTDLVELEGMGVLVDGCELYNGRLISSEDMMQKIDELTAVEKSQCEDDCRSVSSEDNQNCLYVCAQGVHVGNFNQKEDIFEVFTSSASHIQMSSLMALYFISLLISLNLL